MLITSHRSPDRPPHSDWNYSWLMLVLKNSPNFDEGRDIAKQTPVWLISCHNIWMNATYLVTFDQQDKSTAKQPPDGWASQLFSSQQKPQPTGIQANKGSFSCESSKLKSSWTIATDQKFWWNIWLSCSHSKFKQAGKPKKQNLGATRWKNEQCSSCKQSNESRLLGIVCFMLS